MLKASEARKKQMRDYMHVYRQTVAHKTYNKYYQARHRQANKQRLDDLKNKPCLDCGNVYPPCCMDFDHIKPKYKNVGHMTNGAYSKMILEIDKCELVCSNCHRIRTNKRRLERENIQ